MLYPDAPFNEKEISAPGLILAEGRDEFSLLTYLATTHGSSPDLVDVRTLEGNDLGAALKVLVRRRCFSRVKCVGILLDPDRDPDHAFRKAVGCIRASGLPVPNAPFEFATGCCLVGVGLSGGQTGCGEIEDTCVESARYSNVIPCIDAYLKCVAMQGFDVASKTGKRRFLAYCAALPEVRNHLGTAARADAFDSSRGPLARIDAFVKDVCGFARASM